MTEGGASERLHVELELEVDREPIQGNLQASNGPSEEFVGWLQLIAALARLQEGGRATEGG